MAAARVSLWTVILMVGAVLFTVYLMLGYGLIGLAVLLLVLAMAGGALLYWLDGE